tara:strand:- start:4049 stop:5734 length:1686 start_codon:yes stop_codon:yes gene_type:complete
MGFSLSGALSGLAKGGSDILDANKKEEDEQRKKVEDSIYNTTNVMFQNAQLAQKTRTSETKANNRYLTDLIAAAPSMANDPDKQAFVLSLSDDARKDLITLTKSPTFKNANKPLQDYFEAIDDPIEFKDPVTLVERVQGKVIDRPLEAGAYYGVSTTEDDVVDKLVADQSGQFAVAYNMSAERAQGLLDVAKQEIKIQRFKINWAHQKHQSEQSDALMIANVASAQLSVISQGMNIQKSMKASSDEAVSADMLLWGAKQKVPVNKAAFDANPNLAIQYKASKHYRAARHNIIMQHAENMQEAGGVLDRDTESFFNSQFPGLWGGKVDGPVKDLSDPKYYVAKGKNGSVGIYRGFQLKEAAGIKLDKGLGTETNGLLNTNEAVKVKLKDTIESEIATQDKAVALSTELGETNSQVVKEQDFSEQLKKEKATSDYFKDLNTPPKPADASKMGDAVMSIINRGSQQEIQDAFDKISSWKSSTGQSFAVSNAIQNSLITLGKYIADADSSATKDEVKSFLSTSLDGMSESALKDAIRKINAYPKPVQDRDDVKEFKTKIYAALGV